MRGVEYMCIACVFLLLITATSGQKDCGDRNLFARFRVQSHIPASIVITLTLPTACVKDAMPGRYRILYGMNNGVLNMITHTYSSQNDTIILSDLIPNRKYMVLVIAVYDDGEKHFSCTKFIRSGANSTSVGDHDKANIAPIAAGISASGIIVAVVITVIIILLWLIKRRRKLMNKHKGSHCVSVVSTIGNEYRLRKKLYSCPGYLQIFHDPKPVDYEVPVDSVNIAPNARTDPAHLEYLAGSEERPSVTDKDVMMMKSEPIQLSSANMTTMTTSKLDAHKSAQVKKKKLVKPYAVVDVTDIVTKAGLDDTATKHKSKHHKNKHVPSNREALSHSFGSCTDNNNVTQVELNGRFYTVPLYVNLHVPITINPSYRTAQ
ncbi:uncharacterized protein [Dysidea avara]|uniref:uncharacterized protein isoform X2 n=1 Tax=Dysidea avara TaxID=196820 RepID=UPI00331A46F8